MDQDKYLRIGFAVIGRVQGVGFRYFASDAAKIRNLTGWIENRSDGMVCGEVQGDKARIEEFIEQLKIGPPLSYIENVRINAIETHNWDCAFQIKY
jgi:acylphosphatase